MDSKKVDRSNNLEKSLCVSNIKPDAANNMTEAMVTLAPSSNPFRYTQLWQNSSQEKVEGKRWAGQALNLRR